jgi:hypothetical protein
MKFLRFPTLIVTFALLLVSCKKEGLGGEATLVTYLKHHDHTIVNQPNYPDTVYVKFNAKESPGTDPADYDAVFVGEPGEDHVHIEGLEWGDYFLYGAGIDSTGPYRVVGGTAIKIKRRERDEEIVVNIPVVE